MRRLMGFYAYALVVICLPILFPNNYYVTVVGIAAWFHAILAISLNLFMGYAGQISLGHAAFFGIGAYASAILTTRYHLNPWAAMLVGIAIVYTLSNLIARPILRLRGHYLAMATLGLGIIIHIFFVQTDFLTGGPDGLTGIPTLKIFSWAVDTDLKWYAVTGFVMLGCVLASLNIHDSRAGRALRAIHGSEVAAQVMGVDTAKAKAQIFVFSAVIASVAGSLFAHQQAFVSPESFSFFFSIELVTMVVLGGLGSTFGAVFGAIALTLLPEALMVFEDFEMLIFGGILMFMMIFLPQGVFNSLHLAIKNRLSLRKAREVA